MESLKLRNPSSRAGQDGSCSSVVAFWKPNLRVKDKPCALKAARAAALRRAETSLPETTQTGPSAELAGGVGAEPAGRPRVCWVKEGVLDV